jgi:hypothetical protein
MKDHCHQVLSSAQDLPLYLIHTKKWKKKHFLQPNNYSDIIGGIDDDDAACHIMLAICDMMPPMFACLMTSLC